MEKDDKKAIGVFLKNINCLDKLDPYINRVNIFDILKSTRTEIRHSNVLAWLLDVNGSHGFGDRFLREFVRVVLQQNDSLEPHEWLPLNYDHQVVIREWKGTQNDSLDVLILLKKENKVNRLIAIENKIDAVESTGQTNKYRIALEKYYNLDSKNVMLVFLTPYGIEPQDSNWIILTYQEIIECLHTIIENSNICLNKNVDFILNQYLTILKEDIMPNDKLVKICNEIYKQYGKALDLIFENRETVAKKCMDILENYTKSLGDIDYKPEYSSGTTMFRFTSKKINKILKPLPQGESNGTSWKNKQTKYFFEIKTRDLEKNPKLDIMFTLAVQAVEKDKLDVIMKIMKIKSNSTQYRNCMKKTLTEDINAVLDNNDAIEDIKKNIKEYIDKIENLLQGVGDCV